MRLISILSAIAALAGCSAGPQSITRTPEAQQRYEALLAGKIAQRPLNCVPYYRAEDMERIDDSTVVFRSGGGRVYVARMNGPCNGLTDPQTALITHESMGGGPCTGDIATVVDSGGRMPVGSCTWGEFVPYVRPGR